MKILSDLSFEFMGQMKILQHSLYPPKSKFTPDQLPDLSGRVMIVTGGNGGIGKEVVKELLKHNAKVYIATRSQERATAAIEELKAETGKEAFFLQLDLASLKSVRRAAEEFLAKELELHTLFNNAGVMWTPMDQLTEDGYDMQFGTNVVGHFFLTQLLMPALLKGKASSPDGHARVVYVSSGYAYVGKIHFETFTDGPGRKKASTEDMYKSSKLGDVLVAFELARRYGDQGIVSVCLHPGILRTDLMRGVRGSLRYYLLDAINWPAPLGALTPLYAGASTEGVNLNGKFLIPWAREVEFWNKAGHDPELSGKLWTWLEEQVKNH